MVAELQGFNSFVVTRHDIIGEIEIKDNTPSLRQGDLNTSLRMRINSISSLLMDVCQRYHVSVKYELLSKMFQYHYKKLTEFNQQIEEGVKRAWKKGKIDSLIGYLDDLNSKYLEALNKGLKVINELLVSSGIEPVLLSNMGMFIEIKMRLDEITWKMDREKIEVYLRLAVSKYGRDQRNFEALWRMKRNQIESKYKYDKLRKVIEIEDSIRLDFLVIVYFLCLPKVMTTGNFEMVGLKYMEEPRTENEVRALKELSQRFEEGLIRLITEFQKYLQSPLYEPPKYEVTQTLWRNVVVDLLQY